jgi:hypothetical protein
LWSNQIHEDPEVLKLRKSLKLILVGGALAALAVPSVASADTTPATGTTHATFHATQPSGGGGNWVHTYNVEVKDDGTFTGTNEVTGLDNGQTVTVNETVSGTLADSDNNGYADHVTLVSERNTGFYTFEWGVENAPMDGVENSMEGQTAFAWAKDWQGGSLPITFTAPTVKLFNLDLPVVPAPTEEFKNHGQYVKSQVDAKQAAAQSSIGMPVSAQKNKK